MKWVADDIVDSQNVLVELWLLRLQHTALRSGVFSQALMMTVTLSILFVVRSSSVPEAK